MSHIYTHKHKIMHYFMPATPYARIGAAQDTFLECSHTTEVFGSRDWVILRYPNA
jgi:hypothetical protein